MIWVEYDDGRPMQLPKALAESRSPHVTPRDRPRGFYAMKGGVSHRFPLGFMRVSEIAKLEEVLNGLAGR